MDHQSYLLDNYKLVLILSSYNQLQLHRHHHKYFYKFRRNMLDDQLDNLCLRNILDDILCMDYQCNLLDIHKLHDDLLHDCMLHQFRIVSMLIDNGNLDRILGHHIHRRVRIHGDIH